jgi:hypothetical protein
MWRSHKCSHVSSRERRRATTPLSRATQHRGAPTGPVTAGPVASGTITADHCHGRYWARTSDLRLVESIWGANNTALCGRTLVFMRFPSGQSVLESRVVHRRLWAECGQDCGIRSASCEPPRAPAAAAGGNKRPRLRRRVGHTQRRVTSVRGDGRSQHDRPGRPRRRIRRRHPPAPCALGRPELTLSLPARASGGRRSTADPRCRLSGWVQAYWMPPPGV